MIDALLQRYDSVILCDFEYQPSEGNLPEPICMVSLDIKTGEKHRIWADGLRGMQSPPFSVGPRAVFIAFYTPAEFSCFHALGWPLPRNCLDLWLEFRNITNGLAPPGGTGLLSALMHFGLDALAHDEKESMRQLAMRGGPFTDIEKSNLLDYCESDVASLQRLLPKIFPYFPLELALVRGEYMKAESEMEKIGVPLDTGALAEIKTHWERIKEKLVSRIDSAYGVFDGQTFKYERFDHYLAKAGIPWPRTETGRLQLDEDTFREMARSYPDIAPLRELRHALSQLRLSGLAVGRDGRNRTSLAPFRARTGRNQPSNTEFIFGPSCWIRALIRPSPGFALAYIDWSQQEFGIAAALSKDLKMMEAYSSGDPYMAFAKQAGAVPADATKKTHGAIREQFKACVLAVQYGMGAQSLAARINQPPIQARSLLELHRQTYPIFWRWSDAAVTHAMLGGEIQTVFGWKLKIADKPNERSLRNFPMQANGAEMLRLACCLLVEAGIEICAPVHDAILIAGPSGEIESTVKRAKELMERASTIVLAGFKLRSDEKIVKYPDRYSDERGVKMWESVWQLIAENKREVS